MIFRKYKYNSESDVFLISQKLRTLKIKLYLFYLLKHQVYITLVNHKGPRGAHL